MEKEKIISKKKKEINLKDVTICDSTLQMLEKARKDGVETAFDRARKHESLSHRCGFPRVANIAPWDPCRLSSKRIHIAK